MYLPAMLNFFANEDCVKRCLFPRNQNESEAYWGSSGARACAVMRSYWYRQEYLFLKYSRLVVHVCSRQHVSTSEDKVSI